MPHNENIENPIFWELVQGGKEDFSTVYFKHYNHLYFYGLKICQDSDKVKDAIHELFLRLWTQRKNIKKEGSVKFYLLKALKRDLIHSIQRDKKTLMMQTLAVEIDIEFSAEDLMIEHENDISQRKLLAELLNNLPNRQKEALYLKFYLGLTNEEIAGMMEMNYQSVANLLQRGLQSLRNQFKLAFVVLILMYSIK